MKKYRVTYETFHESFGGYDHSDGKEVIFVEARNFVCANNKAKKTIHKSMSGFIQARWAKHIELEESSGKKDKSGKEIFVGDVILVKGKKYTVGEFGCPHRAHLYEDDDPDKAIDLNDVKSSAVKLLEDVD